jgi:hypothetical protein
MVFSEQRRAEEGRNERDEGAKTWEHVGRAPYLQ